MTAFPLPDHRTAAIEVATLSGRKTVHPRPVTVTYESNGGSIKVRVVEKMPDDEGVATYDYTAVRRIRLIRKGDTA